MAEIRVLFFDVGGVLLTNGWDRGSRRQGVEQFGLDSEEFQDRHDFIAADFDSGKLTLDDYLDRTVFYRERPFTREEFVEFMFSQSEAKPDTMAILEELSATDRYLLVTLNNESRELNEHRIRTFGLDRHFALFLSSCYLGLRKPEPEIYRVALDITQASPNESLFIDDRALNLECATRAGIQSIHFLGPTQLRTSLRELGVEVAAPKE